MLQLSVPPVPVCAAAPRLAASTLPRAAACASEDFCWEVLAFLSLSRGCSASCSGSLRLLSGAAGADFLPLPLSACASLASGADLRCLLLAGPMATLGGISAAVSGCCTLPSVSTLAASSESFDEVSLLDICRAL